MEEVVGGVCSICVHRGHEDHITHAQLQRFRPGHCHKHRNRHAYRMKKMEMRRGIFFLPLLTPFTQSGSISMQAVRGESGALRSIMHGHAPRPIVKCANICH